LHKALGDAVRGQVIAFTTCGALLLVYVAALAELKYERYAPGSQITTFPDALWWAVATLTTVGYGDHFPVTAPGRFIAVLLMIGGICLIGAAGATITHWIISQVAKDEVAQQSVTVAHIDDLRDEIARLRHLLEKTTGEANGEAPPRISTTQGLQRN
jgi:voltage-gated potassium channel